MRWLFFLFVLSHGLVHLMGFAKGYGLAEIPELTQPISRGMGLAWLLAGLALVLTAILFVTAPRVWWAVGLGAIVLSQIVIMTSWNDARFGTIANAIILCVVVYGFATRGPLSFRSEYERNVETRLAGPSPAMPRVTERDLEPLPDPVRRYVRRSGAVGRPRVRWFRAAWQGRIRAGPDDPWMPFTAEQHNVPSEPARFFLMNARRGGLPVRVLHAFRDGSATMRVRLLGLIPIVNAHGPEMTRAETVTLLNDMCVLAPGALVDPAVEWEPLDDRSAIARYTVGPHTVAATLRFDDEGDLVDFVSDDRLAASTDETEFRQQRWSTPLAAYRDFDGHRAAARGEGRWHPPDGTFAYVELELRELRIDGHGTGA